MGGDGGGASLGAIPDDAHDRLAGPLATAFGHTYWWTMAMTAVAVIPAAVLAITERRAARERDAAAPVEPAAANGARADGDGATPRARGRSPRPGPARAPLR